MLAVAWLADRMYVASSGDCDARSQVNHLTHRFPQLPSRPPSTHTSAERAWFTKKVIEWLYSCSGLLNSQGQYANYGRVGGCLITGNEDGVKHCAMNILYSLQHLGYAIPPQADAGWIGPAGSVPRTCDPGSGGPENDFTNRDTVFMTWDLMHLAAMLKRAKGVPPHGNQRSAWEAGCSLGAPTPTIAAPYALSATPCSSAKMRRHWPLQKP
ncbi:hypothetical protein [Streptomyces sp. NPDC057616]|uniref:hypothetical protein n=1 Tax=Streptomyces sp. NPDC057616 TaxID=3346183 RepID=UPI0036B52A49